MGRKFFIGMAVFWAAFFALIVVTRGPWWMAALAAIFVGINIWRLQTLTQKR